MNTSNLNEQDLESSKLNNLNGGRIVMNNMAGSRAPLPASQVLFKQILCK